MCLPTSNQGDKPPPPPSESALPDENVHPVGDNPPSGDNQNLVHQGWKKIIIIKILFYKINEIQGG